VQKYKKFRLYPKLLHKNTKVSTIPETFAQDKQTNSLTLSIFKNSFYVKLQRFINKDTTMSDGAILGIPATKSGDRSSLLPAVMTTISTSGEKTSTMWTGCRTRPGRFSQCGRVAGHVRDGFHNVDGLPDTSGTVFTM
jgi:hypothetical protein